MKTWDVAGFVAAFLAPEPRPRASVTEAARAKGLSENRAKDLLTAAEEDGKAYRWTYGPTRPVGFATVPQPTLDLEGDA